MRLAVAVAIAATGVAAIACDAIPPPTTPPASPSAATSASGSPASLGPAGSPPATLLPSGSPTAGGSPGAATRAEPALLDLLPGAAAGLTITFDPDTTATVAADPDLVRDAAAVATGLAIPVGQATPAEFVIVNVVRLRDASHDETWFRDWRDSYDESACERAGGVVRHADFVSGGRTIYVGSCAQGVFTYHVRLRDGEIVVSLTSIGPSRLGEKLVTAIPP